MIRPIRATPRRAGFTLVEVLVVIAIIAVLVSLTAAAVLKIAGKGDELKARHEISNLAAAVEAFKQQMKVDFIPSRFRLRQDLYGYALGIQNNDQLDIESWAYLKKLFPKMPALPSAPNTVVMNWIGDINYPNLPATGNWLTVDLEGHQCLVFFLGGIPTGPWNGQANNVTGFSTNPARPDALGGERIGPFYRDFKSDRLAQLPTQPLSAAISVQNPASPLPGYFSYVDPWGVNPYVYFSSYKKVNGYNKFFAYYYGPAPGLALPPNSASDNIMLVVEDRATFTTTNPPTTTVPMWPYAQSGGTAANPLAIYLNKDTYQILSSGPDKVFGQGTRMTVASNVWQPLSSSDLWSPQFASQVTPKGRDDFSNFHDRPLGSGD